MLQLYTARRYQAGNGLYFRPTSKDLDADEFQCIATNLESGAEYVSKSAKFNFTCKLRQKSNLHYFRAIMPKRITRVGYNPAAWRPGNTALKKRRKGGKPLMSLCPICLARNQAQRPPAPIAMCLATISTCRRAKLV